MKGNLHLCCLLVSSLACFTACRKSESPVPPTGATEAATSAAIASEPKPEYQKLIGKWERPDGGYILELRSVNGEGVFEVGYFNPSPIHVERAIAYAEGGKTRVMAVLRDVNYPGCTYKLTYDPGSDQLYGEYFQAAMGETFSVTFGRLK